MKITALGDSALIVRFAEHSPGGDASKLDELLAAREAIERAKIPGVLECTSAYTTLTLFLNPAQAIAQGAPLHGLTGWFEGKIAAALQSVAPKGASARSRQFEILVCAEGEFALDLPDVAAAAGLTREEVLGLFCAADFRVSCLGFTPGFPYLSGLPKQLTMPRRSVPRTCLPAGSVAIGGAQAGIYPTTSPGGWNVIGRTPLSLFSAEKNPPALLQAGDRVRFTSITLAEFSAFGQEPGPRGS